MRAVSVFSPKDGKVEYVHTLNGSGLALPRVLAAISEKNRYSRMRVVRCRAEVPGENGTVKETESNFKSVYGSCFIKKN
jgi:seryl-tRNA synthetase